MVQMCKIHILIGPFVLKGDSKKEPDMEQNFLMLQTIIRFFLIIVHLN